MTDALLRLSRVQKTCSFVCAFKIPIREAVMNPNAESPKKPLIQLDVTKAGMSAVDKSHVEEVINAVSKGSKFFENEERKNATRQRHIDEILKLNAQFDALPDKYDVVRREENIEAQLERGRTFGSYIHIDMDMFFCAVEELRDPKLRTVPMAVGGMGMLSTSNYIARKFGVRAAMPGFIGMKLCPELVIVHPNFNAYKEKSAQVQKIAAQYDKDFASGGLDELTMNVGPYLDSFNADRLKGGEAPISAAQLATTIREQILRETGLTASAGIAPTPTLAKMCSNINKPNGQYEMAASTRESVMDFMRTMPVRKVPGIGKVQEMMLGALGITTCGKLYEERVRLCYVFTEKTYCALLAAGLGVMTAFGGFGESGASTEEDSSAGRKSVGSERTFPAQPSPDALVTVARDRLQVAVNELQDEGLVCNQVTLKIKFRSFVVKQFSSRPLRIATDDIEVLWGQLEPLLVPLCSQYNQIRLLGVRLTGILRAEDAVVSQPTLSQAMQRKKRERSEDRVIDVDATTAAPSCSDVVIVLD